MTAKSIIEIDIQDGAWRKFNDQVKAYQTAVKGMPGQWGAVGKAVQKTQYAGAQFLATIKEQAKAFRDANTMVGKLGVGLKLADRMTSSIARNTMTFARNIKEATRSILSWGAIMGLFSGLLGAGGLFGIARMAANVSQGSASASGVGSTYGGQKAAQISYGQKFGGAGGVDSLLSNINRSQQSGGASLMSLGVNNWRGAESSDLVSALVRGVRSKFATAKANNTLEPTRQALAPELGLDQINRILAMTDKEVSALEEEYKARKKQLDLSQGTQSAYSKFERALETAAEKLQNLFVNALVPLLPALEKFSAGLLKAVGIILNNPATKGFIEGIGKGLESGANYLTSEKFSQDFQSFINELKEIGNALANTAKFLNKIFGPSEPTQAEIKKNYSAQDWARIDSNRANGLNPNFNPQSSGPALGNSFRQNVDVNVTINQPAGSNLFTSAQATVTRK